jgi:hypothetical protein
MLNGDRRLMSNISGTRGVDLFSDLEKIRASGHVHRHKNQI